MSALPGTAPTARFSICLLEDAAGRLLFIRRAPDRLIGPGKWGFPAGHIEAGESAEACARREIAEEIGPRHALVEIARLGPRRDSLFGGLYEVHLFHYRWLAGEVELNHEHTDHRWLGREDYHGLDVMRGVDEDIRLLDLWPLECLHLEHLSVALGGYAQPGTSA